MEVDNAFGHLVRVAHVISPWRIGLCVVGVLVRCGPTTQSAHFNVEVVPTRVHALERLFLRGSDEAESSDRNLDVLPGVAGLRGGAAIELSERGKAVRGAANDPVRNGETKLARAGRRTRVAAGGDPNRQLACGG